MTQANNIKIKSLSNNERRDPHLRNGSKSSDFRFNPLEDKSFIKNNEILAGLALGELEMWIHRFIGNPVRLKNLRILELGVIKVMLEFIL